MALLDSTLAREWDAECRRTHTRTPWEIWHANIEASVADYPSDYMVPLWQEFLADVSTISQDELMNRFCRLPAFARNSYIATSCLELGAFTKWQRDNTETDIVVWRSLDDDEKAEFVPEPDDLPVVIAEAHPKWAPYIAENRELDIVWNEREVGRI